MSAAMTGQRRPNREDGGYARPEMTGDYGRLLDPRAKEMPERMRWWQVQAPDGSGCMLNPSIHAVEEHPDGTITVSPSIITSRWHGWLQRGVWSQA